MALSGPWVSITQTPIEVLARSMLACNTTVQSVLILGKEGKILAYEDVETREAGAILENEECQIAFFSSNLGILVSIRLDRPPTDGEIETGVRRMLDSDYSVMTP